MNEQTRRRISLGVLVILFTILSAAMAAGGYAYYRREARAIEAERYSELRSIAALKITQIVSWRNERVEEARLAASRTGMKERVTRWMAHPADASLKDAITQDLAQIRDYRGYQNAVLLDPDGRILLSLDFRMTEAEARVKEVRTLLEQVIRKGEPLLGDLFRCADCGDVHLDVAAPIFSPGGEPQALLLLRSDPETQLYPLIQSWPTTSKTAETLLVRREGETLRFLNRLRLNTAPALTFTQPVSRRDLPAAMAVKGRTGEFLGQDYRGVRVLADLEPVPGSPWFMVAKVDASEILAEARYRGGVILGFVGLGILMIGTLLGFLFYFGQAKLYQDLFRATRFESPEGTAVKETRIQRARGLARAAGIVSIMVGCLVLTGWAFDLPGLKGLLPGFVTMKANTAIGFLLAGAALVLQAAPGGLRKAAWICAGGLALLGVLNLAQYLFGLDLHIDQFFFQEPAGTIGTLAPGRMAPASAVAFTLFAGGVILAGFRRTVAASQWLSIPVGLIGLISLLGYLYGPLGRFGIGYYLQLALHTAVTFVVLGAGLLLLNPAEGFMRRFMAESMGGWLLRRLTPFILTVPILVGWVKVWGEGLGWFEHAVAVAFIVTAFVTLLMVFNGWVARSLDRVDSIRGQAEALVHEGAEEIRATLYGIGDGVIVTDAAGRVVHMNPVAERLTGWPEGEAAGLPLEQVFRIINEETRQTVANPVERVLREGKIIGLANHTLLAARDGTERAIADSGAPIFGDRGDIMRVVLVFRDQTAEREAQRALSMSEAKYRRLHESMRDAYVQVDMGGRIVEHNRLFQEMLGYPEDELRHLTYVDLTPAEWHAMEARIVKEQILPFGYSQVYEKSYRRKNGTVFPVELRTNLLTGDDGAPTGMWAIVRDISERKRAEEMLREAERMARGTLDGLSEHIAILGETGVILAVNEAWRRFAQENSPVSQPVCEGADYFQACSAATGMDAPSASAFAQGIRSVIEGRRVEYSQEYACHSPETRRWFVGRVTRFAGEGPVRVVVAHENITERKAAENLLRAKTELLDLTGRIAKVGGWEFDAVALTGTWTDEVARIHDLDPAQGTDVELGVSFYTEESRPRILSAIHEAIESGESYDLELEIISAKGVRKAVHTVGHPVRDENGRVIRVQGIFQDITEKKLAEDQVRAAQREAQRLLEIADTSRKALLSMVEDQRASEEEIRRLNAGLEQRVHVRTQELEAANRELEAFAYSVSHDLRAPLRHMDGFLSMLARHLGQGIDEKGAHYLDVARRATVRMGLLVDGLLSFSRLGRAEMRVVPVDTAHVVSSVLEEFKDECADRVIHWDVGPLPMLHGDPTLLRLVFQNLVGNALKFTRGRPETVIEIQAIAGLEGETGVSIRDNGVGFDPTYGHKLFGVFQRLHREDEFEGTGIGLANVHRIVTRHGGRVWAEGHLNKGAAFFIAFPMEGEAP